MNQSVAYVSMVPVTGVSEGLTAGLKIAWIQPSDDAAASENALARAVAAYPLPNERLLAYAARNPPPQCWYDQDEDLF